MSLAVFEIYCLDKKNIVALTISDLRDGSLLFPCYSWSSPGVLLSPERIEEVQDDFPTGELMLDRNIRVDQ